MNNASLLYILNVLVTLWFSRLFSPVLVLCAGGLCGRYSCNHVSTMEKSTFGFFNLFVAWVFFSLVSEIGFGMQLVRFLGGTADTGTIYVFCICIT